MQIFETRSQLLLLLAKPPHTSFLFGIRHPTKFPFSEFLVGGPQETVP
jgi:hypothetical protein